MPRERGRRNAELSVTPGFFIAATPASMPEPSPRWNWMSGERACLVGVPEAAGLEQGRGDRAGLEQQILQARPHGAVRLRDAVVGVVAGAFADRVEIEVILQIAADAGQIVDDGDAGLPERIGGADAGELQQPRRADGAAAEDHLALGAQGLDAVSGRCLDADRAAALDHARAASAC